MTISRVLIISGVLAVVEFVAIPAGAAFPGSVFSQVISGLWLISLAAVAMVLHRLIAERAGLTALLALVVGLASMAIQLALMVMIVTGRAAPLDNAQTGILAYALLGVWLITVNWLLVSFEVLPSKVGWIGGATGLSYIASWLLVQAGGFPSSTDPAALSGLSPATIAGSVLSMLSAPAYAVWAIWAARRLVGTPATAVPMAAGARA